MKQPSKPPAFMTAMGLGSEDRGAYRGFTTDGNEAELIKYCQKDDTHPNNTARWLLGTPTQQGKRNDLADAIAIVVAGGIKRLIEERPKEYVKYSNGMEKLAKRVHCKKRDSSVAPIVAVLYGSTGTGKTKRAFDWADAWSTATGKDYYVKDSDTKWWDGYEGEELVIIDEVLSQIELPSLLKILDRYQLQREAKGSVHQLSANKFVITSNYHPDAWFPTAGLASREALLRRITHLSEVKSLDQHISNPFLEGVNDGFDNNLVDLSDDS